VNTATVVCKWSFTGASCSHDSLATNARTATRLWLELGYQGAHSKNCQTTSATEYHTAIFVGPNDDAWWSFSDDRVEPTAGFFIAFTRTKQRVVITSYAPHGARTKRRSSRVTLLDCARSGTWQIARKRTFRCAPMYAI
jgi:hypothetical protein